MDKDHKEKLEKEEHGLGSKRVYITREDLELFGFTARCSRAKPHTEDCRN